MPQEWENAIRITIPISKEIVTPCDNQRGIALWKINGKDSPARSWMMFMVPLGTGEIRYWYEGQGQSGWKTA